MGMSFVSLADIRPPQRIIFVTTKGMHMLEQSMLAAGCAYYAHFVPKFPKTKKRSDETKEEYRLREQDLTHDSRSHEDGPGVNNKVPLYKFATNEGWIVSSREATLIGSALKEWYHGLEKKRPAWLYDAPFLLEFIRFCEKCGRMYGFRVD